MVPEKYTPLDKETRSSIPTSEAAHHLSRSQQTLRLWAAKGNGPLQPVRVQGRLAWSVSGIRSLLEAA